MIRNVHQRTVNAAPERVGQLLDTLASSHDLVWPSDAWPPLELSNGLEVGSTGGHGAIRYSVESYIPGREVTFRFADNMGIVGTHTFEVEPLDAGTASARHELGNHNRTDESDVAAGYSLGTRCTRGRRSRQHRDGR